MVVAQGGAGKPPREKKRVARAPTKHASLSALPAGQINAGGANKTRAAAASVNRHGRQRRGRVAPRRERGLLRLVRQLRVHQGRHPRVARVHLLELVGRGGGGLRRARGSGGALGVEGGGCGRAPRPARSRLRAPAPGGSDTRPSAARRRAWGAGGGAGGTARAGPGARRVRRAEPPCGARRPLNEAGRSRALAQGWPGRVRARRGRAAPLGTRALPPPHPGLRRLRGRGQGRRGGGWLEGLGGRVERHIGGVWRRRPVVPPYSLPAPAEARSALPPSRACVARQPSLSRVARSLLRSPGDRHPLPAPSTPHPAFSPHAWIMARHLVPLSWQRASSRRRVAAATGCGGRGGSRRVFARVPSRARPPSARPSPRPSIARVSSLFWGSGRFGALGNKVCRGATRVSQGRGGNTVHHFQNWEGLCHEGESSDGLGPPTAPHALTLRALRARARPGCSVQVCALAPSGRHRSRARPAPDVPGRDGVGAAHRPGAAAAPPPRVLGTESASAAASADAAEDFSRTRPSRAAPAARRAAADARPLPPRSPPPHGAGPPAPRPASAAAAAPWGRRARAGARAAAGHRHPLFPSAPVLLGRLDGRL